MKTDPQIDLWMKDVNNGLLDFKRAARRARALAQIDKRKPIQPSTAKATRMMWIGELALDYLSEALEPLAEIRGLPMLMEHLHWDNGLLYLKIGGYAITIPEDCDDPRDLVKAFLTTHGPRIEAQYTRALLTELHFTLQ